MTHELQRGEEYRGTVSPARSLAAVQGERQSIRSDDRAGNVELRRCASRPREFRTEITDKPCATVWAVDSTNLLKR